jgi:rSAM/selenodomain-associated transferase 1
VLVLFAKWPAAGQVKSRLAAQTSPEWAAGVARAFLLDLLDRFDAFPARRVLAFTPPAAESAFTELVHGRFDLVPQAAGDLGARLATCLREQFALGAARVVVIGSDSPTLPLDLVHQAFAELERADLVLGPATDGGYYLIGSTKMQPALFEGIAWSTERVLLDTVRRAGEQGLRFAVLPPWYDVDSLTDWWMLRGHLAALRAARVAPLLPRTEAIKTFAP